MGLVICKYDNEQNKRLTDKKYKKQDEPWCISLQLSQACEAEFNILWTWFKACMMKTKASISSILRILGELH